MKRSAATPDRRALMVHRDNRELLASPEVAAFLDNRPIDDIDYRRIERKLVRADERALLVELIRATGHDSVTLCETDDFTGGVPDLAPGMLAHIVQHLNGLPAVYSLEVTGAVFTAEDCAQLQHHLDSPGCTLRVLSFMNCRFADPQVAFPSHAPTVQTLVWSTDLYDEAVAAVADATPRLLRALSSWCGLETLKLVGRGAAFSYPALAQLVLANPHIIRLRLYTDVVNDPDALFEALASNRTQVRELTFDAAVGHRPDHNEACLARMAACLQRNETLEVLNMPGIRVCTELAQQRLARQLDHNRSLISLAPLHPWDLHTPLTLQANQKRLLWFSRDFVLGAAESFMQQMGAPRELGAQLAAGLSTTPVSRTYCGPAMALLNSSTHATALQLRSAGLREAIRLYLLEQRKDCCLGLFQAMAVGRIDLLPEDRKLVLDLARRRNQQAFLPAGYEG